MNRPSNKDRLLSMVQGRDPDLSPRPLVYDLTKYGGVSILLSNYYKTEEELRELARQDKQEDEESRLRFSKITEI